MVAFPVATKLVVLFLLLIFNTSADDSDLIDPLLAQKAAIDFSPSLSDDAFASIRSQPITTNEASLQQLSDRLLEVPKPLLLTDSESDNCAGSQHTHKMPRRRSWRRLSERQQHDFCSVEDYQKPRVTRPSKTGAGNIPAGQLGKAGIGRPRATIGGPDEILPDPMLDLKDSQLYGKPNSALCPDVDRKVPVCTPYDQKLTSPAPILVPSRFCKCFLPAVISHGLVSQKCPLALWKKSGFRERSY